MLSIIQFSFQATLILNKGYSVYKIAIPRSWNMQAYIPNESRDMLWEENETNHSYWINYGWQELKTSSQDLHSKASLTPITRLELSW